MTRSNPSYFRAFLRALSLLTRLPVARVDVQYQPGDDRLAVLFYPLVGLILGGILWLIVLLAGSLPAGVAAAMLLACWILLTGAMHLDGLADATDGYFAGHSCRDTAERRQRVLAVMRDPHCGSMAVVALVMLLIAKWAALTALVDISLLRHPQYLAVLLLLPRLALLPYVLTTAYARTSGLAIALATELPRVSLYLVLLAGLGLSLLLLPWTMAAAMLPATALITWYWRGSWQSLIGGYTGDTLGALIEVLEMALLIILLLVARSGF